MTDLTVAAIKKIKIEAKAVLAPVSSATDLEAWRLQYLSRKGLVSQLLRAVKEAPAAERRELGQAGNQLRDELEKLYAAKKGELGETPLAATGDEDKPALTETTEPGHLHPLTLSIRRIVAILTGLGYTMAEGPLVEDPSYNFDLLNIPPEHPARAETDTFYLENGLVLRTHTSPVQLRAVLEHNLQPPFKVFSPGRTFRAERTDASHDASFYQFEGLSVGPNITVADLKSVIESFYSQFFGKTVAIRLRPSFFPFVEPGFEVDVSCVFCVGEGCRICKHSGWIEIMGAGMVHPNVLNNMNIDPAQNQGFAFGGAVDRITMLRHGITDIRLFWQNDLKFLRQFS